MSRPSSLIDRSLSPSSEETRRECPSPFDEDMGNIEEALELLAKQRNALQEKVTQLEGRATELARANEEMLPVVEKIQQIQQSQLGSEGRSSPNSLVAFLETQKKEADRVQTATQQLAQLAPKQEEALDGGEEETLEVLIKRLSDQKTAQEEANDVLQVEKERLLIQSREDKKQRAALEEKLAEQEQTLQQAQSISTEALNCYETITGNPFDPERDQPALITAEFVRLQAENAGLEAKLEQLKQDQSTSLSRLTTTLQETTNLSYEQRKKIEAKDQEIARLTRVLEAAEEKAAQRKQRVSEVAHKAQEQSHRK